MVKPKDVVMEKMALRVCDELSKRNIEGIFVKTSAEARKIIRKMIPKGAKVGLGGSTTLSDSGIIDELRTMEINLLDRYKDGVTPEEVNRMRYEGLTSDVFIASTNAITLKGELINADGMGNRVASIIFGPSKVILVTGVNKIVKNLQDGFERIYLTAAPMNSIRFNAKTPCAETGLCEEETCYPPKRICNIFTIIEGQPVPGRLYVIIINEILGF
ncbi:MAG: lactate utilization protein [Candidatus Schekmanbacteria bacterium]|nr:lactate utilization protein [Candidatus Schekmanbacteria bacterium]